MAQRLKRWESPRNQGRNDKGKGGSARQRQLRKQTQMLRKKLKDGNPSNQNSNQAGEGTLSLPSFFIQFPLFQSTLFTPRPTHLPATPFEHEADFLPRPRPAIGCLRSHRL